MDFMTILSVVIPAYNEENGISEIALRVLAVEPALKGAGVDKLELLVVDDGSKDKTAEVASGIPGVSLIRHPKNKGYGAALKEWPALRTRFFDRNTKPPPRSLSLPRPLSR